MNHVRNMSMIGASYISEGYHQGIKRCFADGAYQNKLETIRLMRNENLGIDLISKITGLNKEEGEKL